MILNDKPVSATIAVKNLDTARDFYEKTLGFVPVDTDDENFVSYKSGLSPFLVYKSKFAGGYGATVATWDAGTEIDAIVRDLKDRGISFEHYDMPGAKIENDVYSFDHDEMKSAWFKDPDGNIICLAGH